GFGIDIPLIGEHRFNDHATTIAIRYGQIVIFDFFQQSSRFEVSHNGFTRSKALQPMIGFRDTGFDFSISTAVGIEYLRQIAYIGIEGEDIDHRQTTTLTDFIVVKVMGRGHFDRTGAFFHISMFIANNRNTAINQWQQNIFTNQILVTWIFRIHRHTGITQHGFGTGGGNDNVIVAFTGFKTISQWVT
ncbi:hypothetical protein COL154_014228, partial [Colletotrichum chrysophilum]